MANKVKGNIYKRHMEKSVINTNKRIKEQGITMVALIVTIIILLILAGIVMVLVLGDKGIIERAKQSTEKHEEMKAREKLEMILSGLEMDRKIEGISDEKIDSELEKEGIEIIDNIVIVDNWQFEIDREIPKIITSMGKGNQNKNIQLVAKGTVSKDYVNAKIKLDIEYKEGSISEIQINGKDKEVPIPINNIYTIEETVTENGVYTIIVKDEEKNYRMEKVNITDITEYIEIWNREDMENFRNRVNSGRTYAGKSARVMDDIDLEGSEENKWIPIGNKEDDINKSFKGTFEGNGHVIRNIYINSNNERQGLFGNNAGIIKDITIEGNIKSTSNYVGGISGCCWGTSEMIGCTNKATVNGSEQVGGIAGTCWNTWKISNCNNEGAITGTNFVGGIIGGTWNEGYISECSNNKSVTGTDKIGGIAGQLDVNMSKCKNTAPITGNLYIGGITGLSYNNGNVSECINSAKIKGSSRVGGIVGQSYRPITLCCNMQEVEAQSWGGGIVGWDVGGGVNNSYNRGTIKCNHQAGGIVGASEKPCNISYTYNTGYVTLISAESNVYAYGGIMGQALAGITCEYSYNIGNVYGNGNVGGVVGENRGVVSYCYNSGKYTSTKKSNSYLGPIRGYTGGSENNCQYSGSMPTIYSIMSRNNNQNWINNTNSNINGGYPILKWQNDILDENV